MRKKTKGRKITPKATARPRGKKTAPKPTSAARRTVARTPKAKATATATAAAGESTHEMNVLRAWSATRYSSR